VLISDKVNIWREIHEAGAGIVHGDDEAGTRTALERWMSLDGTCRARMRRDAAACFGKWFDVRESAARIAERLEALG
jgi:hypothetical protein